MLVSQKLMMRLTGLVLAIGVLGTAGLLGGCTRDGGAAPDEAVRSEELTPGEFPEKRPVAATPPPPPQLKRPETAVYSYLVWISYAYRTLNSDVATPTFTEYEGVRVDSYVQLNRQEGRAIDQRLLSFEIRNNETADDTATVGVSEIWRYRYIDIKTGEYSSPTHDVSYDTTYTVVRRAADEWVVEKVDVQQVGGGE